jgi:hypothetical protein
MRIGIHEVVLEKGRLALGARGGSPVVRDSQVESTTPIPNLAQPKAYLAD